jgi:hypothetical protein
MFVSVKIAIMIITFLYVLGNLSNSSVNVVLIDTLCHVFQGPNSPPKIPLETDDIMLPVWKRPGSFRSRGADGRMEHSLNKSLSLRKSFPQTDLHKSFTLLQM